MKIKNTIYDLRSAIGKKSGLIPGANRQSPIAGRQSKNGIALVITLIMLSVTLIMALAFLAISRRERASVTTTTDSANSRLATDAALASAEAQIVGNINAGGVNAFGSPAANVFNFGLLVSTNYTESSGFVTQTVSPSQYTNLENVNYYYPASAGGGPVNGNDYLQLLANLYYSPRLPVYIPQNGSNDFRFYLDLDRNGEFDDSGLVPNVTLVNGALQTNGNIFAIGDPQWIGLLEHPDQPYGPNNKAIARFAFIAVPMGGSLDLNTIHNQVINPLATSGANINNSATPLDYFYRNQGAGTWEINLAAFLTDLNTNEWDSGIFDGPYEYNEASPNRLSLPNSGANTGNAFDDSRALLAYRYNNNYNTLVSVSNLFSPNSLNYPNFFINGNADGYDDLGLQTTFDTNYTLFPQKTGLPWAGADNADHFYDLPSDLFNLQDTAVGVTFANIGAGDDFTARLTAVGTTNTTYNRYTYYRMLSQLGTDSSPVTGKMNLNYDNLDYTNNSANPTNFMPWTPIAFFTNAADRMLKTYTALWATNYITNYVGAGVIPVATNYVPVLYTNFVATYNMTNAFGISDIPVVVSNQFVYTPAVNRLLQLAANLYEATSTNYYPSVYRPLFTITNQNGWTNVYIAGYTNVPPFPDGTNNVQLGPPIDVATLLASYSSGYGGSPQYYVNLATNVYGIPWIIGARKGFPNFNESVVENIVGVTRRLRLARDINTSTITATNQMYLVSLNTSGGLDFWNPYSNNILDNFTVSWRLLSLMYITNSDAYGAGDVEGVVPSQPSAPVGFGSVGAVAFKNWAGSGSSWAGGEPNANSFYVPVDFNYFSSVSNSVYRTPYANNTLGAMPPGYPSAPPALIPTNYFENGAPITAVFETNFPSGVSPFYVPQWGLLTTNQMQVYVLDQDANGFYHVVDYVNLEQASSQNLNNQIFNDDTSQAGIRSPLGIWNTNINTKYNIPWGIYNQLNISKGLQGVPSEDGTWQSDPEAAVYSSSIGVQMADFQAFFMPFGSTATLIYNGGQYSGSNFEATAQAPYSPTRYAVGFTFLQPNDPLVHYLTSDMNPSFPVNLQTEYNNFITNVPEPTAQPFTLGKLDYNFQPWGGNPYLNQNSPQLAGSIDTLANSLEERDPGTYGSDDWDFPTNKLPNVGWIGRVHRGTPWQTVYMKSTDITGQAYQLSGGQSKTAGTSVWAQWTGDREVTYNQFSDAINSAPNQDRLLFDLFTAGINDNATRGQLSVNNMADQYDPIANPDAGLAGWSAVLSGVVVPPVPNTTNGYSIISPAGVAGANSFLDQVVTNINATRNAFVNLDGTAGTFEHKGDILAVPMLTVNSPFLNLSQTNLPTFNDEMYEWVPQQIMGLVRGAGTPRYVVYCYGQTLQPAPNGIYTGGATLPDGESVFGMVTNYQVTAESATRAVIRIDGLTDANGNPLPVSQQHPHAVIESINALPPD